MSRLRHRLAREFGSADRQESMDVLLQLTLPIILILAFLVVTEVQSLNRDLDATHAANAALTQQNQDLQAEMALLNEALAGTETGKLKDTLDLAILSLQRQLLLQAADDTVRAERARLQLERYAAVLPAVADVLAGQLDARFVETSQALATLYNRAGQHSEQRLSDQALTRFRALAEQVFAPGSVAEFRRNALKNIEDDNQQAFQSALNGGLALLEREASAVQLELVLAWIASRDAEGAVKSGATAVWRALQTERAEAAVKEGVQDFVDLKTVALVRRLTDLSAPLLDATCQQALTRACGDVL